jgi:hypothetical protein
VIATILGFLGSRLGGAIAAAVVAVLTIGLGVQTVRLGAAHREVAKLADRIENPGTGYIAKLSACRGDVDRLTGEIARQNEAVTALKTEGDRRAAKAAAALSEAARGRASAEARAAKLLKNPPSGIDACARAMSAFETVKESLQ